MASTSLSARSPTPTRPHKTPPNKDDEGLKHAPAVSSLAREANKQVGTVKALDIKVSNSDTVGSVSAFIHIPQDYRREQSDGRGKTAAILISGASGGVVGPSSIYLSIADKMASLQQGIPVMRLDYRFPARNPYCVSDVIAAMDYLRNGFAVSRVVLVGWSFGSAPVFSVAAQDERVVGCATIASQTAETEGIKEVAVKGIPVLLLHGSADQRLGASCSESLAEKYRRYSKGGKCELKILEGDDHSLTKHSLKAEEMLCTFILEEAGEDLAEDERQAVVQRRLVSDDEKIEKMKLGGDLNGESIE